MKSPLRYQVSEFDCAPTSLLNALLYIFEREEIPASVVRNIALYTLDCYNEDGEEGQLGTSRTAMHFVSNWLKQIAKIKKFPLECHYIGGKRVGFYEGSPLSACLKRGGAVVLRVWDETDHYILITSEEEDYVRAFDPYYQTEKFSEVDIEIVTGKLFSHNRIIPKRYFDSESESIYAMGTAVNREALLFNRDEQTNFALKKK